MSGVRLRRYGVARRIDQVDALMGGVVARDVAEVALDAFLRIDARDGSERKIEILEIGDVLKTAVLLPARSR